MSSVMRPGQTRQTGERPPTANAAIFWGLALVAAGVAFLALTLDILPSPTGGAVGVIFAATGLVILTSYVVLHAHWWTLIAGPALVGLGAVILLPGGGTGAIFLGTIGLGFTLVALTGGERWWAIIPAGSLLTLALVSLVSSSIGGLMSGAVLFFGLASTFGVLSIVRVHGHRMGWPLYPALGLLIFGMALAMGGSMNSVVWPLGLVAAGVVLLVRAMTRRT